MCLTLQAQQPISTLMFYNILVPTLTCLSEHVKEFDSNHEDEHVQGHSLIPSLKSTCKSTSV